MDHPAPSTSGRRRAATMALAALALACAGGPAAAHSDVAATRPADRAVLAAPPAAVTVTYTAPLGAVTGARVTAGGRDLAGAPRISPADARAVVIPLRRGVAPSGAYAVTWAVTGADGHALSGGITFRVRPPGARAILRRLGAVLVRAGEAVVAATAR